ncbi:MAG: hypothetical protein HYY02_10725 [Chloroflexi bacterium]|nr:hypothetical protein [Chloroflexota bacterium]
MGRVKDFVRAHPQLAAFGGLAVAMVAVLLVAARDVALEPGQRATLIASTVALAGLCVWIINWE